MCARVEEMYVNGTTKKYREKINTLLQRRPRVIASAKKTIGKSKSQNALRNLCYLYSKKCPHSRTMDTI